MAFIRDKFKPQPVDSKEMKGVTMQILIGEDEGAPNYIMRRFRVEAGGYSAHHSHDYEHVVFIISGKGTLFASGEEFKLAEGTSLLVEPNEIHQFKADRGEVLEFLCTIPRK